MGKFSAEEKRKGAQREVGQRRFVYPKLVMSGRMTQAEANYQTELMDEIRQDYEAIEAKERLI